MAPTGPWSFEGARTYVVRALVADGDTVAVGVVRERTEVRSVHNLTVDGIHTYFVLAGDDPVLVHNCVQPYEVGTFRQFDNASLSGDDLAIHHVGQHHAAQQVAPGHTYRGGPAIALPTAEHARIRNLPGTVSLTPRQLLARDIWNLRRFTNAPNSALRELIDLNRQTYPGVF